MQFFDYHHLNFLLFYFSGMIKARASDLKNYLCVFMTKRRIPRNSCFCTLLSVYLPLRPKLRGAGAEASDGFR